MGSGRFSATDWDRFTTARTAGRATSAIFGRSSINPAFDPKDIVIRESRDSADNPESTAVLIGLDVTGSMGMLADTIARTGLDTLFTEIYAKRPVTDPHVAFAAVGDIECDQAPLQVSQFEADIRIADQVTDLFLEHGGGGNNGESYPVLWYFAGMKTSIDCFERRRKKGYLFTVGDEPPLMGMDSGNLLRTLGLGQGAVTAEQARNLAERMYHVFHIVVEQGSYCRNPVSRARLYDAWNQLLPQHVIPLTDYTKLAEVIVSAIQVCEGADSKIVSDSWSGDTSLVVAKAIGGLAKRNTGLLATIGKLVKF